MNSWDLESLWRLGIALGIGLLVGLERGFHLRGEGEGGRIAGFRTFALIGFFGGLAALVARDAGVVLIAAGMLSLTVFLALGVHHMMRQSGEIGITTLIAALLTFFLGLAAGYGEKTIAAIGGVVMTLVLSAKEPLHGLLHRLDRREVVAVIKLLILSLVILPLLPDEGMGPWEALNPRRLWWMVVLVAGISSAGYFAMKFLGPRKGLLATALLGGLASSTATTLSLARRGREAPGAALPAAAALAASAMVAPRLAVICVAVSPPLLLTLGPALLAFFLSLAATAALLWRRDGTDEESLELELGNPFEIGPALKLALLIGVIMLLTEALPRWLGSSGVYLLAAVSGLADVAAITLSYGEKAGDGLGYLPAAWGIVLAVSVNNLVKAGIGWSSGGRAIGLRLAAGMAISIAAAAAAMAFGGTLLAPATDGG